MPVDRAPTPLADPGGSLRDLLRDASRALGRAGVEAPERDARLLAAAAVGCSGADLIARPEQPIDEAARARLGDFVRRRCAREPVSRILGAREFYGRAFALSTATLDPRPDSEVLIEAVLQFVAAKGWRDRSLRVLDVGTGSGCLLVTLLAELPSATGVGTDIAQGALDAAAANARQHGVSERAVFVHARGRGLESVVGPFDIMVSNPPYIASDDIPGLAPEVRDFDPRAALDGGADGLRVYRQIIPEIARVLPYGYVAFEVGAGQADAVEKLLRASIDLGCRGKTVRHPDLGGHTRCVSMEIQL